MCSLASHQVILVFLFIYPHVSVHWKDCLIVENLKVVSAENDFRRDCHVGDLYVDADSACMFEEHKVRAVILHLICILR